MLRQHGPDTASRLAGAARSGLDSLLAVLLAPACPLCQTLLDRGRAVGPYERTLRRLVHLFKYDRRHTLAAPLGALMRRHGTDLLADADCVVPVPLHPRRRRARGFNQAAELAAHLGPPVVHALRRTVATPPQTGLPAAQRHGNVRGVFAPARTQHGC